MNGKRRRLRLIHTADVHIGEDFRSEMRLSGLRATVDACLAHSVDAVLIAGDLFDNARISAQTVQAALDELTRLSVPVLITPGNHDALLSPSVYDGSHPSKAGSHVWFLEEPQGGHIVFEDLGLSVWARAMVDHHPGHNPLEGYQPLGDGNWQVALAHGHYVPSTEKPDRSSPLLQDHIGLMGCDYLALGHWHRFLDVSTNGVPAFYPGSPSEAGGSYPSVNLVTLDPEAGVTVERIRLEIAGVMAAATAASPAGL